MLNESIVKYGTEVIQPGTDITALVFHYYRHSFFSYLNFEAKYFSEALAPAAWPSPLSRDAVIFER